MFPDHLAGSWHFLPGDHINDVVLIRVERDKDWVTLRIIAPKFTPTAWIFPPYARLCISGFSGKPAAFELVLAIDCW